MDTLDTIHSRRSIRKYKDKKVSDKLIKEILKAGMAAPSARNQQPWQFIVITDKIILQKIPNVHPYASMVAKAPLAILVCGDLELETAQGYWIQDCSAAIQNMLLAITDLGLGAVWTGVYPRQDRVEGFKKLFNLPKNIIPLALIPIGYPAEKLPKLNRFKDDKIHYNKW